MKKTDWIILILLLASPIVINYFILGFSIGATINGSIDGWLGYYGTIVGSMITMFVLYRTRIWNKEDNEDTKTTQNKILKYQAKLVWLEGLRKQLDLNYRILDFQETSMAIKNIKEGNFQLASEQLAKQIRDIEMQGYNFDLYLLGDNLEEHEKNYIDCYVSILKEYGEYVGDLMLICEITNKHHLGLDIGSFISDFINQQDLSTNKSLKNKPNRFLMNLQYNKHSNFKLNEVCESRMQDYYSIHSEKEKLCKATNLLLKFEEKKIESILE